MVASEVYLNFSDSAGKDILPSFAAGDYITDVKAHFDFFAEGGK